MGRNKWLHSARLRMRWSQEKAAEEAKIARKTYIELETGKRTPQIGTLDLLCSAFQASPRELGYNELGQLLSEDPVTPAGSVVPDQSDGLIALTYEQAGWIARLLKLGEKDMTAFDASKRAAILKMLGAAGVVLTAPNLLDMEPWERLGLAATHPSVLNQKTLDHFKDLMRVSWELSNSSELDVAERMLPQFLPRLLSVAHQQPAAAILASQGLQLQSILIAHKLKIADKIALCQKAVEYARLAQDYNTLVAALLQLAVAYVYDNQYDYALKFYQEALQYCNQDKVSPLLCSRTHVEAAAVFAQYRRMREADFYLDLALETFPNDPSNDPTFLYADHNRGVLALYNGQIQLARGNAARAWDGFESFKDYRGTLPERIRLEIVNHQGKAAILDNDLEKYALCLEDGLGGAVSLESQKRYSEAASIYQSIPLSWAKHARIMAIAEQYRLQRVS